MISTGAKVLGPIYIGSNSKIGANAVVLEYSRKFYGGRNPGKGSEDKSLMN